jgi:hypothetical protein
MNIQVVDIREGDRFVDEGKVYWTALADAILVRPDLVILRVQHEPDGGIGEREWDNPSHTLTIVRDTIIPDTPTNKE